MGGWKTLLLAFGLFPRQYGLTPRWRIVEPERFEKLYRKELNMPEITMYSTQVCPYCVQADKLLKAKGAEKITKILIDREAGRREEMMEKTGRRTVPQIFIGDRHIGGFDDLRKLDLAGGLAPLLASAEGGE